MLQLKKQPQNWLMNNLKSNYLLNLALKQLISQPGAGTTSYSTLCWNN